MADSLLLGFESRAILATWLRGRECPRLIARERWARFLAGDLASIGFSEMAQICDCYGPEILDVLMWPGRPHGIQQPQA